MTPPKGITGREHLDTVLAAVGDDSPGADKAIWSLATALVDLYTAGERRPYLALLPTQARRIEAALDSANTSLAPKVVPLRPPSGGGDDAAA